MMRPIADAGTGLRHVFLRDMTLEATIGIYPHERAARQRIRINVDLAVEDDGAGEGADRLDRAGRQPALCRPADAVQGLVQRLLLRRGDH